MSSSENRKNHEADKLKDMVKEALNKKGILKQLKSKLRNEVFHILENKIDPMPEKTKEIFIATEMIREFLTNLNLTNTLSVFLEEIGQPKEMMIDRSYVCAELGINVNNTSIPLLVSLIEYLHNNKEEREMQVINSTDGIYDI